MHTDLSTMHRVDLSTPAPASRAASNTIERAMYEQNGMVRCFLSDQIQSVCADNDQTALGRQLQTWKKQGHTIDPYSPPPITYYEVDIERDRRIAQGIFLTLKTGKTLSVTTQPDTEDFRNIIYASNTALALTAKTTVMADEPLAKVLGPVIDLLPDPLAQPVPTMTIRDYYRNPFIATYPEMVEIGTRVTDNVHAYLTAAHVLKDMAVIPRDYTNDSYWPTIPLPPLHQTSS